MKKNTIYTIPNLLSFYRLLMFPYILYLSLSGHERLFAILLTINLVTDVLDGMIARLFNVQTDLGARLDSIADLGTYIAAITGIFVFKASDFQPHLWSFFVFIFLLCFAHILSLIKFGQLPSLYLYSWKIGGYIQGVFFIVEFYFFSLLPQSILLYTFFMVFLFDSFCQIVGQLFGKHKMLPQISPNKTYKGLYILSGINSREILWSFSLFELNRRGIHKVFLQFFNFRLATIF